MNSNHKNGKDDRSLDHELDQLDQLYHSDESIEPPDLIDQTILNKARRAVEPKNSWLDFGWIHGVTTVALVVLTFSIFTTQRETGEFEPTVGKSVERAPAEVSGQLAAGAAVSSLPVEAPKKEIREKTRARDQDGVQQHLLDQILMHKHAGDERWIKELSDFKNLYPDFPLPQELQNQE